MYYRRKILLALLEIFEGELEKIRFQKLLMFFSKSQHVPQFHFVPYKYGCFSFSANSDMHTMIKYNQVSESQEVWKKEDKASYIGTLKEQDQKVLITLKKLYGKMTTAKLIELSYKKYPYYAINSKIAEQLLDKEDLAKVIRAKSISFNTTLFTIGYEGISLEEYLNKLIINNVKILIDVRRNPFSMKYGFSKNQLKNSCEDVGIKYLHFPKVGIKSEKRKELNNQEDYEILLDEYQRTTLIKTGDIQQNIFKLLESEKRIALSCFEANINQCHRKPLAEAIARFPGFNYTVIHL